MSDVCTYKLLKRLIPDKPGIEVSTCTRSIDQCMKPAVKMLRQKFRCKQRIIRSQETDKLPPLLFPALVIDFFSCSSRSAQYEGSLQLSSNRSIAPSCLASCVQPPLMSLCRPASTSYGLHSFKYFACKTWNSLPENIRTESTLAGFKRLIRTIALSINRYMIST